MRFSFYKRIALPYILLILGVVVILAVALPLVIKQTIAAGEHKLALFYWILGVVSLLAIAVALLFAHLFYVRILRPLQQLIDAARHIGTGAYKQADIPGASSEVQVLGNALRMTSQQIGAQIEALTTERAMLSTVLKSMTDGVLIADFDGHVQLLNPAAERLFRIKEFDALGRSVVEVMRHHQLVDLWSKTREGDPQTISLELGANHTFLQVIGIPLSPQLSERSMLLFQDLTQIHRLETVRRDFISNVSHELRTPMASLKALSDTLLGGALDDPPAARRFVTRMDTEVDNLTLLVNELLELSRIEGGRVNFEFQRITPSTLLIIPTERMSLQAERVGLTLINECPSDLPPVFADKDRISQVIINLLHNAIKFTPHGGTIWVGACQEGKNILFWVKDTGVGIAKKDLTRIFERFYKADRARSGGGTGLGLSIARHMIEAHGGTIWAESEEGSGSSFFFTIPLA